jgi:hypothetical protein
MQAYASYSAYKLRISADKIQIWYVITKIILIEEYILILVQIISTSS